MAALETLPNRTPKLQVRHVIESMGFKCGPRQRDKWHAQFAWPPDTFAMAATILQDSGAYLQAVRPHEYPPDHPYRLSNWLRAVDRCARQWRRKPSAPPPVVVRLLDIVAKHIDQGVLLHEISQPSTDNMLWLPYLQLMCMADQACRGIGLVFPAIQYLQRSHAAGGRSKKKRDYPKDSQVASDAMASLLGHQIVYSASHAKGRALPFFPTSLCNVVDPSRAIVLPKMRTSQRGVTLRSFSLHLALLSGTDVEPVWNPTPLLLLENANRERMDQATTRAGKSVDPKDVAAQSGPYNIVLLPWPHEMRPSQFKPLDAPLECLGGRPPEGHSFFRFEHAPLPKDFKSKVKRLLEAAQKRVGPIHGLVLPEMALTRSDFEKIFPKHRLKNLDFVACGVYEPPSGPGKLGKNYCIVRRRVYQDIREGLTIDHVQEKHHRWALDRSQINAYSLGSTLRCDGKWWEGIDLPRRRLHFFALDSFAAFTVLICEDLARPDPVGDAVRAVGANLVICLLLDGPQLATRWSSRYATVLADDPGSSVITLSSLGMVKLSRLKEKLHECSRVIGLWREPDGNAIELQLPEKHDALVLSLSADGTKEWSVDGRDDGGMAGTLRLADAHPIAW